MGKLSDEEIVKIAKARVAFKMHALVYVIVNVLFVAIWWLTSSTKTPGFVDGDDYFWPVWPMLGWGIGLVFHGVGAYGASRSWEDREIERLREQNR